MVHDKSHAVGLFDSNSVAGLFGAAAAPNQGALSRRAVEGAVGKYESSARGAGGGGGSCGRTAR